MKESTKRRWAIALFTLALFAPFVATAARWRIIWLPSPFGFPPSIPVPVPA